MLKCDIIQYSLYVSLTRQWARKPKAAKTLRSGRCCHLSDVSPPGSRDDGW